MEKAFDILKRALVSTGMTRTDAEHLLAQFLQEEAYDYVKYISEHLDPTEDTETDPDLMH